VVRFDVPGRTKSAATARRAPCSAHRHRHDLDWRGLDAEDDGLDLIAARSSRARMLAQRKPDPTSSSSRRSCTTPCRCSAAARSTCVSRGHVRSAGCHRSSRWAQVLPKLLVPGGRLFIRDDTRVRGPHRYERPDRLLVPSYPYFEREEPSDLDETGTYVETRSRVRAQHRSMSGTRARRDRTALLTPHAADDARRG